jgi:hypothetical protein
MTMMKKRRAVVRMVFCANRTRQRIGSPEADIREHAHFIGDESEEPSSALFEQTLVGLYSLRLAKRTGVHLDLVLLLGADHEQMSEPSVFS